MNPLLSNYIAKKEIEQKQDLDRQKNELLISEGLYEKVYSNKDTYDAEYPNSEWDSQNQRMRYFKTVPIEITDSEYEQLKKLCKPTNNEHDNNTVAVVLTVLAWIIFIGGFILGIVLGNVEVSEGFYSFDTDTEFSFIIALRYWAISLISGIFILGFAEIIKLLTDIKNK